MTKTTGHYEDTDLAVFAMQLLDGEEHEATAQHVQDCVFCRQELARLQGDLAACGYGVEMYTPAASVRERLMQRIGRENKVSSPAPIKEVNPVTQAAPVPAGVQEDEPRLAFRRRSLDTEVEPRLGSRRRSRDSEAERKSVQRRRRAEDLDPSASQSGALLKGVFGWLGWAIAAGFAVAGVSLYQQQVDYHTRLSVQTAELTELRAYATGSKRLMDVMTASSAKHVLLSPPQADSGSLAEGHVIYDAAKGSLILLADHLAPLGIDKIYELWLIPADGSDPVPAGSFHPDAQGNGSVILPSLPKAVPVKAYGITIEDGAGSQTPTMPIVLAGS